MIKTSIAWVSFDGYVFNASWPLCTTMEELEAIWNSWASAIMMKSCTIDFREWNPEPRYVELWLWSINSMGLPNLGYKSYLKFVWELKSKFRKPVIASISGLCKDDFVTMIREFQHTDVDLIEANFSCPNVPWKPQIWYDFEAVDQLLSMISDLWDIPLGIKMPPYFDLAHYDEIAKIISKYRVRFISTINSVWNTLIIDPEKEQPVIKPKWWFGWLWWSYVKPIALANVRKFYELLWNKIDIIWVWWITNWIDAFEFILAWASAVQIGTQFAKEWVSCFARIESELLEYMSKKWYSSLNELKGKLKPL